MAPVGGGGRVVFTGEGSQLFVVYLLNAILPTVAVSVTEACVLGVGNFLGAQLGGSAGGLVVILGGLVGGLLSLIGSLGVNILFTQKMNEFYYQNLKLDGQSCEYRSDLKAFAAKAFIHVLLNAITLGIYGPWMICYLKRYVYENTAVNGQMGRLVFEGNPSELLGKYILGLILTLCTFGIYMFWFMNDIFAFMWENTKLDGRPLQFRRDPLGLFGTLILHCLLMLCTLGLYFPWMMCNLFKWEAEHVS